MFCMIDLEMKHKHRQKRQNLKARTLRFKMLFQKLLFDYFLQSYMSLHFVGFGIDSKLSNSIEEHYNC